MEQNALSRRQFQQSGFDESEYTFNHQRGEFEATIDCKRWGKGKKLITYMTFEDGRKIVTPIWPRSNYEGLANMNVGSKIQVTYAENNNGTLCVRRVVLLSSAADTNCLHQIIDQ